ncbi:MAG: Dna2/Cas4 domain-containing protein [Chloroflexi bacterium]|nr:Dna2/Cas4 domain-containing protein [Chloroflexota bacterium]
MKFAIPLFLLLIAFALVWLSRRQRACLGIPQGRLVYADMGAEMRVDAPLFDAALNLVGRPDYLVRSGEEFIPIEVKSGRTPAKPYDSHVYQLAAYCVLVASRYGRRPTHGIIRYPQREFRVEFTPELERGLHTLLDEMHAAKHRPEPLPRSHNQAARCRVCGFLARCDQSL